MLPLGGKLDKVYKGFICVISYKTYQTLIISIKIFIKKYIEKKKRPAAIP